MAHQKNERVRSGDLTLFLSPILQGKAVNSIFKSEPNFHEELFEICVNQLGDLELIQNAYGRWMKEHSEKLDSQP